MMAMNNGLNEKPMGLTWRQQLFSSKTTPTDPAVLLDGIVPRINPGAGANAVPGAPIPSGFWSAVKSSKMTKPALILLAVAIITGTAVGTAVPLALRRRRHRGAQAVKIL